MHVVHIVTIRSKKCKHEYGSTDEVELLIITSSKKLMLAHLIKSFPTVYATPDHHYLVHSSSSLQHDISQIKPIHTFTSFIFLSLTATATHKELNEGTGPFAWAHT
jgi:hypothetical protein